MSEEREPTLIRLLPTPNQQVPLRGVYLALNLRDESRPDRALWFSNFVVSLDGRVSLSASPDEPPSGVPADLSNSNDWRLFQELVAQSDAVVVSGRYEREVADGRAEPLVQLDRPGMEDLQVWRHNAGLSAVPDVVVLSSSLNVELVALRRLAPRVIVVTGGTEQEARASALRDAGIEVLSVGETPRVDGQRLAAAINDLGFRTVFAAAGPVLMYHLVASSVLDRLFVTTVSRLLGGERFATMLEGEAFAPPTGLQLESLHLDAADQQQASQLFSAYRL